MGEQWRSGLRGGGCQAQGVPRAPRKEGNRTGFGSGSAPPPPCYFRVTPPGKPADGETVLSPKRGGTEPPSPPDSACTGLPGLALMPGVASPPPHTGGVPHFYHVSPPPIPCPHQVTAPVRWSEAHTPPPQFVGALLPPALPSYLGGGGPYHQPPQAEPSLLPTALLGAALAGPPHFRPSTPPPQPIRSCTGWGAHTSLSPPQKKKTQKSPGCFPKKRRRQNGARRSRDLRATCTPAP